MEILILEKVSAGALLRFGGHSRASSAYDAKKPCHSREKLTVAAANRIAPAIRGPSRRSSIPRASSNVPPASDTS